jgi:hypothetical protein
MKPREIKEIQNKPSTTQFKETLAKWGQEGRNTSPPTSAVGGCKLRQKSKETVLAINHSEMYNDGHRL